MSAPPVDALDPEGWSHNGNGEITEGRPQGNGDGGARFKHTRSLQAKDVWRMRVEVGGWAWVGFASEHYNAEKHMETYDSTAWVFLDNGTTFIYPDISRDGEEHINYGAHLKDYIPKTLPYDLALRITKDGNVPQIQFNDDGVWHDFAPDMAAVKAGPWFPLLVLNAANDRLSDHCVHRPKPTKSAGKTSKAPAAPAAAAASADGAGAAAGKDEESASPPQKKARHDEGGGSH